MIKVFKSIIFYLYCIPMMICSIIFAFICFLMEDIAISNLCKLKLSIEMTIYELCYLKIFHLVNIILYIVLYVLFKSA